MGGSLASKKHKEWACSGGGTIANAFAVLAALPRAEKEQKCAGNFGRFVYQRLLKSKGAPMSARKAGAERKRRSPLLHRFPVALPFRFSRGVLFLKTGIWRTRFIRALKNPPDQEKQRERTRAARPREASATTALLHLASVLLSRRLCPPAQFSSVVFFWSQLARPAGVEGRGVKMLWEMAATSNNIDNDRPERPPVSPFSPSLNAFPSALFTARSLI